MPATRPHYHVYAHSPGTLPSGDEPATFTSRKEAERYAKEEKAAYQDAGMHVTGNARDGYTIQHGKDSYGGFSLYVEPCHTAECTEEDTQP